MDSANKGPGDPHNPPTIVSVLDRESLLEYPRDTLITHALPRPPDEAFAAKHIPHLDHTVKEMKVFHWKVKGWKRREEKLTSPEFSCGGHEWYVPWPSLPPSPA